MSIRFYALSARVALLILMFTSGCARQPSPEQVKRAVRADFVFIDAYLRETQKNSRLPPTLDEYASIGNTTDWYSLAVGKCRRRYGYATSEDGKTAVLMSVGPDGLPNTSDDVIDKISVGGDSENQEKVSLELVRKIYEAWHCD